jgi:hypothetical protein
MGLINACRRLPPAEPKGADERENRQNEDHGLVLSAWTLAGRR